MADKRLSGQNKITVPWKARSIEALKPKNKRYIAWDISETGKGVRVSPKGKRTFIYMYRYPRPGGTPVPVMKSYKAKTLAEFEEQCLEDQNLLRAGIDPRERKKPKLVATDDIKTVSDGWARYVKDHLTPADGTITYTSKKANELMEGRMLPLIGDENIKTITTSQVLGAAAKIAKKHPTTAHRAMRWTAASLNYWHALGYGPAAPIFGGKAVNKVLGKLKPRDRVLSKPEIRNFWHNLPKTRMDAATRIALKLILASVQRPSDIVGARWNEVHWDENLECRIWVIPAKRYKTDREQRVPLSPIVSQLFDDAKELANGSEYLFPSGKAHMAPEALAHAVRRNTEALKMNEPRWVPYDLRRTGSTSMGDLDLDEIVIDRCLGHAQPTIRKTYNLAKYDKSKREALDEWGEELQRIINKGR